MFFEPWPYLSEIDGDVNFVVIAVDGVGGERRRLPPLFRPVDGVFDRVIPRPFARNVANVAKLNKFINTKYI